MDGRTDVAQIIPFPEIWQITQNIWQIWQNKCNMVFLAKNMPYGIFSKMSIMLKMAFLAKYLPVQNLKFQFQIFTLISW